MSTAVRRSERRAEQRRRVPPQRITWAPEDASGTCPGWLNDDAASGLSFVTPTRNQPAPGEALEVAINSEGPAPRYRLVQVVRATTYDRFFSLVGCRNITGVEETPQP